MINHGTRGGYYAHRRLDDPPCQPCKDAINEYVKEYRSKNGLKRNRERDAIRRKALADLRDKYRDEYETLVEAYTIEALEEDLI